MSNLSNSDLRPVSMVGMTCCQCGTTLRPQELVSVCPDCGAVFCVACTVSGNADQHICDNDD